MCRHLAYVGPPIPLSHLIHDPPHSLERQSYAARELLEGRVAADGFGVAWYQEAGGATVGDPGEPLQYRTDRPIWADAVWRGLARRLAAPITIASVRNATDPSTLGVWNVHPFTHGRWAFTHNGYIGSFRERFLVPMRGAISTPRQALTAGATDTETLFLMLLDLLDAKPDAESALAALVASTLDAAESAGETAYLNLLLADGKRVYATRAGTRGRSNSLYVAAGHGAIPGSIVASEPLDADPAWRVVPHGSLVVLDADAAPRVEPLPA
jgi:gamma-glutamyl hercynylcysteine S-oxide hydrolase